jgi:hypothetical protein
MGSIFLHVQEGVENCLSFLKEKSARHGVGSWVRGQKIGGLEEG